MSRITSNGALVAVIGVLLFVGVGVAVAASQVDCGAGPKLEEERSGADTPRRNDDTSWFAHKVCVSLKPQHNR